MKLGEGAMFPMEGKAPKDKRKKASARGRLSE